MPPGAKKQAKNAAQDMKGQAKEVAGKAADNDELADEGFDEREEAMASTE